MNQTMPNLSTPRDDYATGDAFTNDLLNRKALASKLTNYLDRLRDGAVLAIDAQWGDGKSWFGKNWAKQLRDADHTVIEIDAFAQDYIDDPFLLIAAELNEAFATQKNTKDELKKTMLAICKTLLPTAAKLTINALGRMALGTANLSSFEDTIGKAGEELQESGADAAEKWLEDKFDSYSKEKETLAQFREQLSQLAAAQDKPIIIFIDELDRCKPTFAVRLVERLKHFFNVPNIVFVLLLNRDQLQKAVKGVYGNETDAAQYLGKFVNFFFKLPQANSSSIHQLGSYYKYFIEKEIDKFKFDRSNIKIQPFIKTLSKLAEGQKISLRDIQKCIALFSFAYPNVQLSAHLAYIITLKVTQPDLYRRLSHNDIQAHRDAQIPLAMAHNKFCTNGNNPRSMFTEFEAWHQYHDGNAQQHSFSHLQDILHTLDLNMDGLMHYLMQQIDFQIEN
ncbi:KAP family P-loop NTPase fold protein [Iodobacter ciconiae]|uniref:KAP NTPase domain-containing protein n=1 Tax=Iodobacter ciconiae TaxID=2496266 RepID=A0A3S8ZNU6_9NEIS|nr:P-loop NTPase fold protein [Iodobacter ciconiae]AZN35069.1 hypothetical protein EJO50_00335 [Iodobacter ciconiae]